MSEENTMEKEQAEQELQKLLVEAQQAIDKVKAFAVENDLLFEITGWRRGPWAYNDDGYFATYDLDENDNRDEDDQMEICLDALTINRDWLPSMC